MPRPARVGILVHFSSSTSLSMQPDRKMLTGTVREALALGADGVSLHINIGREGRAGDAGAAWSYGRPVPQVERAAACNDVSPWREHQKPGTIPEIVGHVARIGAECGADIVKTLYPGDADAFAKIVKSTPVPIVIAGRAQGKDRPGRAPDDRGCHGGGRKGDHVRQKRLWHTGSPQR